MPRTPARALGDRGEEAAFAHLARSGYRVLARNVRCGAHGELDGVALDGRTLCFVEVKSAAADSPVAPEEHVTKEKKKALLRAARHYLRAHGLDETSSPSVSASAPPRSASTRARSSQQTVRHAAAAPFHSPRTRLFGPIPGAVTPGKGLDPIDY
jgi:putative endonuclease